MSKSSRKLKRLIGNRELYKVEDRKKRDPVGDADQLYFDEHPGEEEFWREYVPGEFGTLRPWLFPGMTLMVCVTQVQPGLRTREAKFVAFEPGVEIPEGWSPETMWEDMAAEN